jgi:cell division protein FtsB
MASTRAAKVAAKPNRRAQSNSDASYEHDFYAWSYAQARALRSQDVQALDWENLAEEIESLGRSDRREVRSRLKVILVHLLKWQLQKEHRSLSWNATIVTQRDDLEVLLNESPSLRRQVSTLMSEAYPRARQDAAREMDLVPEATKLLPASCPFTVEQVLDEEFLPE